MQRDVSVYLERPNWSRPPFGIELSRFKEDEEMAGKREA